MNNIRFRPRSTEDSKNIYQLNQLAFGEAVEANLVNDLFEDKSAKPIISFVAEHDQKIVGFVLFTRVYIMDQDVLMHILAPLAVSPHYRGMGIGGHLINHGLASLKQIGSQLSFVLGHESYYSKFGFEPNAARFRLTAPFPIPPQFAGAWMVQELNSGALARLVGQIQCADSLNKKEYWQE